VIVKRELSGTL